MTQKSNEWNELRGRLKAKFGKLSDSEIDSVNGHLDNLPGKVEKAYGYPTEKAKQECREFMPAS